MINRLSVRKGERVENPEFGTIIYDAIFEPFSDLRFIRDLPPTLTYLELAIYVSPTIGVKQTRTDRE